MRKLLLPSLIAAAVLSGSAWAASGPQPGVNSPWNPVWAIPVDSIKNTYRATITQLSPNSGNAGLMQICGASGIVTRITHIDVSGRATSVQPVDWLVAKRSTAGTLSNTATTVPLDASVGAASSTVEYGGTSGTVGTLIGYIASKQEYLGNLTTGLGNEPAHIDFGHGPSSALILRGAGQCATLQMSQTSVGGNLIDIDVEWTEE